MDIVILPKDRDLDIMVEETISLMNTSLFVRENKYKKLCNLNNIHNNLVM